MFLHLCVLVFCVSFENLVFFFSFVCGVFHFDVRVGAGDHPCVGLLFVYLALSVFMRVT